jgi:hypothetical protein
LRLSLSLPIPIGRSYQARWSQRHQVRSTSTDQLRRNTPACPPNVRMLRQRMKAQEKPMRKPSVDNALSFEETVKGRPSVVVETESCRIATASFRAEHSQSLVELISHSRHAFSCTFVPSGGLQVERVTARRPRGSYRDKCDTMVAGTNYDGSAAIACFLYDLKFVTRYAFDSATNTYHFV